MSGEKRIDFTYSIHKDYVLSKEAVYVAFPFAAEKPAFAYETQNGWVDPARDELAGGSREWYAVQHWAAVRRGDWSAAIVPHDAPLGELWRYRARELATGISAALGDHLFLADEQLLGNEFRARAGRGFYLPLLAGEWARI